MDFDAPDAVDKVFAAWSASPGYQDPLMDGIIVDEFGGGDGIEYDVYRQVVERLNATFKPKVFMPYGCGGQFHGGDRSTKFAQAALDGGGYVCPEYYLIEQPSKSEAEQFIHDSLVSDMLRWEKGMPGVIPRLIVVLGYMSQPTESLNVNPSVNFKVYMDMQMRALATHPACFGLGGFQWYHSSYCDEENVRWAGRLYRHYAIEGNTKPLANDPYILPHLRNPDFAAGTEGWTIAPAEPGSVKTGAHAGYSWLEGRYPRTNMGDTFLLVKRSDKKPNVFSQEIKNLTPGRMYSLKMITADYQDLVQEKSEKKTERRLDPSGERRVIHRSEAELPVHVPQLLRPPPRQVQCPVQLLDELPLAGVQGEGGDGEADGDRLAGRPAAGRSDRPGTDVQLRRNSAVYRGLMGEKPMVVEGLPPAGVPG